MLKKSSNCRMLSEEEKRLKCPVGLGFLVMMVACCSYIFKKSTDRLKKFASQNSCGSFYIWLPWSVLCDFGKGFMSKASPVQKVGYDHSIQFVCKWETTKCRHAMTQSNILNTDNWTSKAGKAKRFLDIQSPRGFATLPAK